MEGYKLVYKGINGAGHVVEVEAKDRTPQEIALGVQQHCILMVNDMVRSSGPEKKVKRAFLREFQVKT